MLSTSKSVPYSESEKEDLSDYPIFPFGSMNDFEQQKHSKLPRKRAIAMQEANKKAADAAVAALNPMKSGADIIKAYTLDVGGKAHLIIDAGSANKIAANKPTTWRYLHSILMQRQISELLIFHKKQLGITPQPAAP